MALYAPKSQSNQPQMYGVPGGMYITPQQQPQPGSHPAVYNRMQGMSAAQGVPVGMTASVGNPLHQGLMQQQQQVRFLISWVSFFYSFVIAVKFTVFTDLITPWLLVWRYPIFQYAEETWLYWPQTYCSFFDVFLFSIICLFCSVSLISCNHQLACSR